MKRARLLRAGLRFITSTDYRFIYMANAGRYNSMPDEEYLKRMFKAVMGTELNLEQPTTFNEKLQWLKLYDRNPLYTTMVDKHKVKQYVADIIGEEYIIPTLGVWDDPDDIDFEQLPNQFVLKCNHNSGLGMCICKDKSTLNYDKVRAGLRKGLAQDYYLLNREWPYKNVPRKIIGEKYLNDKRNTELIDYKFFCFNGEPLYCQVICNRSTHETIDFFDMNWQHQDFTGLSLPYKPYNNSLIPIPIPITFDEMRSAARILADRIPFVRIDFYDVNGRMYFGEITFYPAGGFGIFEPDEWNYKLGNEVRLEEAEKDVLEYGQTVRKPDRN